MLMTVPCVDGFGGLEEAMLSLSDMLAYVWVLVEGAQAENLQSLFDKQTQFKELKLFRMERLMRLAYTI